MKSLKFFLFLQNGIQENRLVYMALNLKVCADSGQDHTTDSNDGFLVTTACFDMLVARGVFRMFPCFEQSIYILQQNWFKIRSTMGNPGGFDFAVAFLSTGATNSPGDNGGGGGEDTQ